MFLLFSFKWKNKTFSEKCWNITAFSIFSSRDILGLGLGLVLWGFFFRSNSSLLWKCELKCCIRLIINTLQITAVIITRCYRSQGSIHGHVGVLLPNTRGKVAPEINFTFTLHRDFQKCCVSSYCEKVLAIIMIKHFMNVPISEAFHT